MLFIASTDRYTLKFVEIIHLKNKALEKLFAIENDYQNQNIIVSELTINAYVSLDKDKSKGTPTKIYTYNVENEDYKILLKFYLDSLN